MSNDNEDIEMNYPRGEESSSKNANDGSEIQTSEPTDEVREIQTSEPTHEVREVQTSEPTHEVEAHGQCLSKHTYDFIKYKKSESEWQDIGNDILQQKSPMGNTALHVAALYGNDACVEKVVRKFPQSLNAKNDDEDTALHVAARAGKISTLDKLLYLQLDYLPSPYSADPKGALDKILVKNSQGNTFFHEAFLNGHKDVMNTILDSQELEAGFKELVGRAALFWTNKEEKSVLHLAIEKGFMDIVDHALTKLTSQHPALDKLIQNHQALSEMLPHPTPAGEPPLPGQDQAKGKQQQQASSSSADTLRPRPPPGAMANTHMQISEEDSEKSLRNEKYQELKQELAQLFPYDPHYVPPGQSPLILAILKKDEDILQNILTRKKEWIHLRDNKGRTALHHAASIGYIHGVKELLENCSTSCNMERDNDGLFPLHLASAGGHYEVLKKLLEHCAVPKEILDNYGRNILHIAALMRKFDVVRYILQDRKHGLIDMINDKDNDGNTPLHLAALHWHPKIVHALIWDKRVDLSSVNKENQTALDACMQFHHVNSPLRQRLVWTALGSAGVQQAERGSHSIEVPRRPESPKSEQEGTNMDPYKDIINTLMLVSTLITTVTFAAGFTLPGGTNSSDPEKGMALMLHHVWFNVFIFCITISMYGSISVTIILIWAQLGDITLAFLALRVARPLLGVVLATLSVAFMAGVHLVIRDLSWLVYAFWGLSGICILMILLLYITIWLPSSSSNPQIRRISYYPLKFLIWLVDQQDEIRDKNKQSHCCHLKLGVCCSSLGPNTRGRRRT